MERYFLDKHNEIPSWLKCFASAALNILFRRNKISWSNIHSLVWYKFNVLVEHLIGLKPCRHLGLSAMWKSLLCEVKSPPTAPLAFIYLWCRCGRRGGGKEAPQTHWNSLVCHTSKLVEGKIVLDILIIALCVRPLRNMENKNFSKWWPWHPFSQARTIWDINILSFSP